uniref:Uncharacterized protein n=1 Tax=Rhizophora mucronata TaxID=61149 RepID=A0A2P2PEU5_RHIMU
MKLVEPCPSLMVHLQINVHGNIFLHICIFRLKICFDH